MRLNKHPALDVEELSGLSSSPSGNDSGLQDELHSFTAATSHQSLTIDEPGPHSLDQGSSFSLTKGLLPKSYHYQGIFAFTTNLLLFFLTKPLTSSPETLVTHLTRSQICLVDRNNAPPPS
ncbi:hypothetical protein AMTR_s00070p00032880 [Amborella trichopoda]|uniref:Uncharacterized protein n=1 Tax=Amborella trichopoda TaxID=13333 RepID=U5DGG9_AMBTC|nr:hypothetical protein AMTR_s00070p00032880 [Amborella trichopoda]